MSSTNTNTNNMHNYQGEGETIRKDRNIVFWYVSETEEMNDWLVKVRGFLPYKSIEVLNIQRITSPPWRLSISMYLGTYLGVLLPPLEKMGFGIGYWSLNVDINYKINDYSKEETKRFLQWIYTRSN